MAILKQSTVDKIIKMEKWGCIHLFWRFYLIKKYSPATKGLKGMIWTIDFAKKDK